ncbi:hypothetical protein MLD38_039595 [Melastoma candidum]|uniref:Uncharacterized protein n=1 Tax=Melastoma candidum TaxID=119954 RepID=A0ACB9L2K5_9MYRT|nr:hypothetical protein MLD38_039595 [Melastoma candidum]
MEGRLRGCLQECTKAAGDREKEETSDRIWQSAWFGPVDHPPVYELEGLCRQGWTFFSSRSSCLSTFLGRRRSTRRGSSCARVRLKCFVCGTVPEVGRSRRLRAWMEEGLCEDSSLFESVETEMEVSVACVRIGLSKRPVLPFPSSGFPQRWPHSFYGKGPSKGSAGASASGVYASGGVDEQPKAVSPNNQIRSVGRPLRKMGSPDKEWGEDIRAFMQLALDQAKLALDNLEVPIGCVIVEEGKVIASGRNRTNETRNATRHAEMEAIDTLLEQWQLQGSSTSEVAEKFSKCLLFVTCEPCIMCASALSIIGIKEVYFGCANDKFGGCGSILSLHSNGIGSAVSNGHSQSGSFKCYGGIMASEAVSLLRDFYEQGNPNAPKPHRPRSSQAS